MELVPYVVGVNPNSPSNPHSALASGGFDVDKIDSDPPQEVHVLYGGVVGGPDKRDNFYDIRSDWPQTEVKKNSNQSCIIRLMTSNRSHLTTMPLCSH
jgi:endoglucanase